MMSSSPIDALTQALEHQTRVILAEIDKRFNAIDYKWEYYPVVADPLLQGIRGAAISVPSDLAPIAREAMVVMGADADAGDPTRLDPPTPLDANLTRGGPPSIDGQSASLIPFIHDAATQCCYQEVEAHLTASNAATDGRIRQIEADTGARAPCVSALESYAADADVNTDSPLRQIEEDGGVRVAALESVVQVFDVWRPQVDSFIEHLQTSVAQIRASLPSLESPWSQYTRRDGPGHPNAYGAASILVPVKCVLHEPPLGGYDGCLDDDPKFCFTYIDAPLDQAVGCVGHTPAAAVALRTDVVGVVGHGLLAQVVAAGSTHATCSTIYLAADRNFADISVGALSEETMEQGATTLQPSFPEKKSVLLSSSTDSKLGGLKAYHLARGLCDRCDEKWHRGHKCNDIVQLHTLQEVWNLLAEPAVEETTPDESQPGDAVVMAISSEAFSVSTSPLQVQVANGSTIS
jgi:hypothetical protein